MANAASTLSRLSEAAKWGKLIQMIEDDPTLARVKFPLKNQASTTVLHAALSVSKETSKGRRIKLIRTIIDVSPRSLSIRNSDDYLPLHLACIKQVGTIKIEDREKIIKLMMAKYPEGLSQPGGELARTPLHLLLATNYSFEIRRDVGEADTSALSVYDSTGLLPLHMAAKCGGSLFIVKWLIEANPASLRQLTADRDSLISIASNVARPISSVVHYIEKSLQSHGTGVETAVTTLVPSMNGDPVADKFKDHCAKGRWEQVIEDIRAAPADALTPLYDEKNRVTTVLHQAIHVSKGSETSRIMLIDTIVTSTPSALELWSHANSLPVHSVCGGGTESFDIATRERLLVDFASARPRTLYEVGGKLKRVPLHLAIAQYMSAQTIRTLIEMAPETTKAADKSQNRAVHIACDYRLGPETVEALLDADPESVLTRNSDGQLPIDIARRNGMRSVISLLEARMGIDSYSGVEVPAPRNTPPPIDPNDDSCCFCFERLDSLDPTMIARTNSCAHKFCFSCVREWTEDSSANRTCPICRQGFARIDRVEHLPELPPTRRQTRAVRNPTNFVQF